MKQNTNDFKYDLIDTYFIEDKEKNVLAVSKISFNGGEPKIDIRKWSEKPTSCEVRMYKGISLTLEEAKMVIEGLQKAIENFE